MIVRLLPYRFKIAGALFLLVGIVLSIIYYQTDYRIDSPVFAIYTAYLTNKFFSMSHTNLMDELIFISSLVGLFLLVFTEEKVESELIRAIRYKSFLYSFAYNFFFLIACILFIYGQGFFSVILLNLFAQQIIYLITFYWLKRKIKTEI